MRWSLLIKISVGIIVLGILLKIALVVILEPWIGKKIQAAANELSKDYRVEVGKVRISLLRSGLELDRIAIFDRKDSGNQGHLKGEIPEIQIKGINMAKAIFKKDVFVREVLITGIGVQGEFTLPEKTGKPRISPVEIRIGKIIIREINISVRDSSTAQSYSVTKGMLTIYDLHAQRADTLSPGIVSQLDFSADELVSVSPDSLYTYRIKGVSYTAGSTMLKADSIAIQPNYDDYDFTARNKFRTDRIDAMFSSVFIRGFSAGAYVQSGSLVSPYIEVGKMDVKIFRDNRKEDRHDTLPAFQDVIYRFPGELKVDSLRVVNGDLTYTEHVAKATHAGRISFNAIDATIYMITNDTIYKTKNGYLKLEGSALLMGRGKLTLLLKARIFDSRNTFTLSGTLDGLDAADLNPILEKNAFVYATSGTVDGMSFHFTADNDHSSGQMTLRYHGLELATKDKQTNDTTAFKERLVSAIVNRRVVNANPDPGKPVRVGVIYYDRNPERFLFNYCFKSLLTGIKSSISTSQKDKDKRKR